MDKVLLEYDGFVYLEGGKVRLGTKNPLLCRLEGHRKNETPERYLNVSRFWISKYCVTNAEYERFDKRYERPLTSQRDRHPVTNVTYMNALTYTRWWSETTGIEFTLPNELQWVFAAAPFGWEFPWGNKPDKNKSLVYNKRAVGPLEVDDPRYGENWCGLLHMGGNVQEFVLGTNYAPGTNGAEVDGMYCIVKGGDWAHCKQSPGVARRGIVDVAGRAPTLGFRLASSYNFAGT